MNDAQAVLERNGGALYCRASVVDGSVSEADRSVDFIVSTEDIDGHGTIVRQNWQLERYRQNPVVLYAHDHDDIPIGTASNVRVKDGKLQATVTFSTEDLNPKAEQVWKNVNAKIIRGISAGFWPHSVTFERQNDREIMVLDDNELWEMSVCPVPSNPNALSELRSLAPRPAPEDRKAVPFKAYTASDAGSWDGAAAVDRIRKWASSDGTGDKDTIDWGKYRNGFAWYDAENPEGFGAYKLPHHDVVDGKLVTLKAGVVAAGNAMSGSRGGVSLPDGDVDAVKAHLAKHYAQFDMKAPWQDQAANKTPPPDGSADPTSEPIERERTEDMSDQFAIAIRKVLSLGEDADEATAVTAVEKLRSSAHVGTEIEKLLGCTGAQAIGAVRALKETKEQHDELRREVDKLKASGSRRDLETLIHQGLDVDRNLSPAEAKHYTDRFEKDLAIGGDGESIVEDLRGWLRVASKKVNPARRQIEGNGGGAMQHNGKAFEDMTGTERHAIKKDSPELYEALRNDALERNAI